MLILICIIKSPVHRTLSDEEGKELSSVIKDLKSSTLREIIKLIKENKQESRLE